MGLANKDNEVVKFDKVNRTKQGEALVSLIFASYWNEDKPEEATKDDIMHRLTHANHLFKLEKGGAYGKDEKGIKAQFQRFYTIGHDMGIWESSDLKLSPYAQKVATFDITVKEYISTVFLNLFTYVNGEYTHILHKICEHMLGNKDGMLKSEDLVDIFETPVPEAADPEKHEKEIKEQVNIIFNYLLWTNYFKLGDSNRILQLNRQYSWASLMDRCNLIYQDKDVAETREYFNDPMNYAQYISSGVGASEESLFRVSDANDNRYDISKVEFDDAFESRKDTVQKIIYGPPGIGKSYSIKNEIRKSYPKYEETDNNPFVFRTTLHPDYDYASFIGQVMPVVKGEKITYDFKKGVFTESLKMAIEMENERRDVYLILEEMSRANVAAVFGDIFQLLDRKNGVSEYRINNDLIAKEIYGNENEKIYLPSNFHIIGTVNASDQNVYVMDTAFKRRFDFTYMDLNPQIDSETGSYLNSYEILVTDTNMREYKVNWINLYQELNTYIVESLELNEDKQVGQFFVKFTEDNIRNTWSLVDKLFHYLWEDAQKVAYTDFKIFKSDLLTFSAVYGEVRKEIMKAEHRGDSAIPITVFSEDFIKQLKSSEDE